MLLNLFKRKSTESKIPVIKTKPETWINVYLDSVKALDQRGLYKPDLKYRSFNPSRLNHILRNGTDRDETSKVWEESGNAEDIIYALGERLLQRGNYFPHKETSTACVAVYDNANLTYIPTAHEGSYKKRKGAMPVAVLKINCKSIRSNLDKTICDELYKEEREFKNRWKAN